MPGEKYSYQSMGILLAAEIVERITGEPFAAWLARAGADGPPAT